MIQSRFCICRDIKVFITKQSLGNINIIGHCFSERHRKLLIFSGQHQILFVLVRLIRSTETEIAIILNHFYATHRNMKHTNIIHSCKR